MEINFSLKKKYNQLYQTMARYRGHEEEVRHVWPRPSSDVTPSAVNDGSLKSNQSFIEQLLVIRRSSLENPPVDASSQRRL